MAAIVAALRGGLSGETLTRMVAAAELALRLSSEGSPSSAAAPAALLPAASDAALPTSAGHGGPSGAASAEDGAGAAAEGGAAAAGETSAKQQDAAAQGARPRLSLKIKLGQGAPAVQQGAPAEAQLRGSRKRGLEAEAAVEPDQDAEVQPPRKRHRLGAAPQEGPKDGVPAPEADAAMAGGEGEQDAEEALPNGNGARHGSQEDAGAEEAAAREGAQQSGQDGLDRSAPDQATGASPAAGAAALLGEEREDAALAEVPGSDEGAAAMAADSATPAEPAEAEQGTAEEAGKTEGMQAGAPAVHAEGELEDVAGA